MFEGRVTTVDLGWESWVRALPPHEIPGIAADLVDLEKELTRERPEDGSLLDLLGRAVVVAADVAATGRGVAYLIG